MKFDIKIVSERKKTNLSDDSPAEVARKQRAKEQRAWRKQWRLEDAVQNATTLEDKKEAARLLEEYNGKGYSHLENTLGQIILEPLKGIINHFSSKEGIISPKGTFVRPKPNAIEVDAAKRLTCFDLQTISSRPGYEIKDKLSKSDGGPILFEKFPDLLGVGSKQPVIVHIGELELADKLKRVEALFLIVRPSRDSTLEGRIGAARQFRDLGGDPGWVTYLEEVAKSVKEERIAAEKRIAEKEQEEEEKQKIIKDKNQEEEGTLEDQDTERNVLPFEVLPPGFLDSYEYYRAFGLSRAGSQAKLKHEREERLRFVESLGDHTQYMGSNEIGSKYIVFVFESNVVAECPMEGNAIYVINGIDNWQTMLRNSKKILLRDYSDRVHRIIHKSDWKLRLKRVLNGPNT